VKKLPSVPAGIEFHPAIWHMLKKFSSKSQVVHQNDTLFVSARWPTECVSFQEEFFFPTTNFEDHFAFTEFLTTLTIYLLNLLLMCWKKTETEYN